MLRRTFLGLLGAGGISAVLGKAAHAAGNKHFEGYPESFGVLFDATRCIGCRRCEAGCNKVNNLPPPPEPFDDLSVLDKPAPDPCLDVYRGQPLRPHPGGGGGRSSARTSASTAWSRPAPRPASSMPSPRRPRAGSIWDGSVCVGCRYCMIACPFEHTHFRVRPGPGPPDHEVHHVQPPITTGKLTVPGCVGACPVEALVYGKRTDLVNIARARISEFPNRYLNHLYGEHEMGGTSWLYLSGVPFRNIGLREDLGVTPAPELTSGALAAVPLVAGLWPVLLLGIYAVNKRKDEVADQEKQAAVATASGPGQGGGQGHPGPGPGQGRCRHQEGHRAAKSKRLWKRLPRPRPRRANNMSTEATLPLRRPCFTPFNVVVGIILFTGP